MVGTALRERHCPVPENASSQERRRRSTSSEHEGVEPLDAHRHALFIDAARQRDPPQEHFMYGDDPSPVVRLDPPRGRRVHAGGYQPRDCTS